MFRLSEASQKRLVTCDPRLQEIVNKVSESYDVSVLCGHRGKDAQEEAVSKGMSKLHFPKSKHNSFPSLAIDLAPFPIDWNDRQRFCHLAGFVQGVAVSLGFKIRWGGDFNQDNNLKNDSFVDMPHFELVD